MIVTPQRRVVQSARAPARRAGGHPQENLLELYSCRGRVAQLGEHLLCKHAIISPKSNRRPLTVQTPLQIGLLTGATQNKGTLMWVPEILSRSISEPTTRIVPIDFQVLCLHQ